ncbi:hypothetical protein HK097_011131, partial [Rhizophlyctis rosea]
MLPANTLSTASKVIGLALCVALLSNFLFGESLAKSRPARAWRLFSGGELQTAFMEEEPVGRHLRIAIINHVTHHYEVVLPLLHAFVNQPNTTVELFATQKGLSNFGIKPLFDALGNDTNFRTRSFSDLDRLEYTPDLAVLVTCSRDINDLPKQFTTLSSRKSPKEVLCMMHDSGEWSIPKTGYRKLVQKWIEASRINIITLSPHVNDYLTEYLPKWNMSLPLADPFAKTYAANQTRLLPAFPPVFDTTLSTHIQPFIAMQGYLESNRRNYTHILTALQQNLPLLQSFQQKYSNVSISIFGSDNNHPGRGPQSSIPKDLKPFVKFHINLPYPEYYALMSSAIGILPAFAAPEYLQSRASSSIGAAVIVGTPPIATKEIVGAYRYLDGESGEAYWTQEEGESE